MLEFTIPSQSTLPTRTQPPRHTKDVEDEEIAEEQVAREAGEQADRQAVPPMSPPEAGDPLAEAPDAKWYVSPPGGGQFGPANADMMRTWIAEGRVTADSLVWREGWDDWAEASTVFPQLASPETASYLPSPEPTDAVPDAEHHDLGTGRQNRPSAPSGILGGASAGDARRAEQDRSRWVGCSPRWWWCWSSVFIWVMNRS